MATGHHAVGSGAWVCHALLPTALYAIRDFYDAQLIGGQRAFFTEKSSSSGGQFDCARDYVDHWQRLALGYAGALGIGNPVARYVSDARGLCLSDRPLEEPVRMLRELTEPVQTIYFARRWRVAASVPGEITGLPANARRP